MYEYVVIDICMGPNADLSVYWDIFLGVVGYRPVKIWIQTYMAIALGTVL